MAKPSLSDELKIKLALARFAPMRNGQPPMSYEDLRDFLKKEYQRAADRTKKPIQPTDKTIQKAIVDAFQRGLVEIAQTQLIANAKRDGGLELKLERAFPIEKAIVVKIAPSETYDSDAIHKQLGYALAKEIQQNRDLIRPGDIIGVGSGRGPHYCISALNKFQSLRLENITLGSLTGSLFSHGTEISNEFLLDADTAVGMLAQHFEGKIETHPIVWPIAAKNKAARDAFLSETWLNKNAFETRPPNHAIIGVGVLYEKHRFYLETKSSVRSPILEPIGQYLDELVQTVDHIRAAQPDEDVLPIADVCNRLFYIPPRSMVSQLHLSLENRLKWLIESINNQLVTVTKTQLSLVNNLMVVAGTPIKAAAINYLLTYPPTKIDWLCVDSFTADAILKSRESSQSAR